MTCGCGNMTSPGASLCGRCATIEVSRDNVRQAVRRFETAKTVLYETTNPSDPFARAVFEAIEALGDLNERLHE